MGDVSKIKLEPVDLEWSNPEITKVSCIAGAALAGKSFLINSAKDAGDFYVWYDDSVAADPASATTGIAVTITGSETAAAIATLTAAAIELNAGFFAKVASDTPQDVIIYTKDYGTTTASSDVDSLNTVVQVRAGAEFLLGFTDSVEMALSEDLVEILAMQAGSTILDKIRSGVNIDPIEVAMKESDVAKLKEVLSGSGSTVTPSGGTEIVGIGTGKYATNISADGRRLVLHPKRLATSNILEDNCFMLAYPILTGLNFSGDEEHMLTVEFHILPDGLLLDNHSIFNKGDHKQNILK